MIEERHNFLARFVFNAYEFKILKNTFNRFILLNDVNFLSTNKPVLLLPNHFSWWDGFFVDFLVRSCDAAKKFHIIMLEEQLKRYWFFRFLGAIGFNPTNPKGVINLANKIANLLSNPLNLVVFYPQGEIQLFDEDIKVKSGLQFILNKVQNDIEIFYPFFKIQYFENRKPDLICKIYNGLELSTILNDFDIFQSDFLQKFNDFKKTFVKYGNYTDLFVIEE